MQKQYTEALADLSKAAELKTRQYDGDTTPGGSPRLDWGTGTKRLRIFTAVLQKDPSDAQAYERRGFVFSQPEEIQTKPSQITTRAWRSNPIPTFTQSGVTPT